MHALQGALHRISTQIVRALPAPGLKQNLRFLEPKIRQILKIAALQICSVYQERMESASEKIGKYSETSTNATNNPMKIMMAGSIKLNAAAVRVATSSS